MPNPIDEIRLNRLLGSKLGKNKALKEVSMNKDQLKYLFFKNYKNLYGLDSKILDTCIGFIDVSGTNKTLLRSDSIQQIATRVSNLDKIFEGEL